VVFRRNSIVQVVAIAVVCLLAFAAVEAGDVSKKWRVGLSAGFYNAQDEVESASANELFSINPCARTQSCPEGAETLIRYYRDPRSDSSVFGNLDINPGAIGTVSVQYGLKKLLVIEASVGYQKSDVGDVEVSVQLPGNPSLDPNIIPFNFVTRRVTVGELERIPIQLTALARFRPRASFNPYLGAGIGYTIIGFEPTSEFNQLSMNMDASRGRQMRVTAAFAVTGSSGESLLTDGLPQIDLQGATVEARDTFEWHLAGGAEFTLKKRWSLFLDVRWVDASRSFAVGFNGEKELGNSLPNYTLYDDSPIVDGRYGPNDVGACTKDTTGATDQNGNPVNCTGGGLIDYGRLIVRVADEAPPTTDCSDPTDLASTQCILEFVFEPDGEVDPGQYYVAGGEVDYDGFSMQFGARFTFGK